MFKKIIYILLAVSVTCGAWGISSQPIFSEFSENFEVYLNENSSNAIILSSDARWFAMTFTRTGESCKTDASVADIFGYFKARTVFVENTSEGVSYYGFTDKIKYREFLKGETVNIHVFVGKTHTTVGSPLIYGSC